MFRDNKSSFETKYLFELSDKYINEGTKSSLTAAYKLLVTLFDMHPEKAVQGKLGVVKVKLKNMGALEEILHDESNIKNNDKDTQMSIKSKL